MNFVDYAKLQKNDTFSDIPFNNVDALIFAEMGYINFGAVVKDKQLMAIRDLKVDSTTKFYHGSYNAIGNKRLFDVIKDSKRFGDVKVGYALTINDVKTQTQFAAVTFILPTGEAYISFRGTDTSINGIKEDLLIAYQDHIPGAKEALDYMEKILSVFDGRFYLGGHSKGGNLALYAAFTLKEKDYSRLIEAYSFDGPGFKGEISDFESWEHILPKVKKFITGNDMIGVIYNKIKTARIVYSKGILLGGHDLFKWQVDRGYLDFIYMTQRTFISQQHELALTNWLEAVPNGDKQLAVEIICEFMGQSKTPLELITKCIANISSGKNKWNSYSINQKRRVKKIFAQLAKFYLSAYSPKAYLEKKREEKEQKNSN